MKKIAVTFFCLLLLAGCSKKFKLDRSELNIKPDWEFNRKDLTNSGSILNSSFNGKLNVLWEHESNDKPSGELTIYYDKLIYPGAKKKIRFIDIKSGEFRGSVKPKKPSQTSMIVKDSLGFVITTMPQSKLRCINLLKNKTVWMKRVKDALTGSIIYNNRLFVSFVDGQLVAYNPEDGEIIWTKGFEHRLSSSPIMLNDMLCVVVEQEGIVFVDPENGEVDRTIPYKGEVVAPPIFDGNLYLLDFNGEVSSLNISTEAMNWQKQIDGQLWSPAAVDDRYLYLAETSGHVFALDKKSGEIVWEFDAIDAVSGSILVVGNYLLFGTLAGDMYSLRASDGSVADKRKLKGPVSIGPVSDGEVVLVADNKGLISCFGVKDTNE